MLETVEHGVAEPDEVVHVGEEPAAGPLAAVVHVRGVAEAVVLVAHIIPDKMVSFWRACFNFCQF